MSRGTNGCNWDSNSVVVNIIIEHRSKNIDGQTLLTTCVARYEYYTICTSSAAQIQRPATSSRTNAILYNKRCAHLIH